MLFFVQQESGKRDSDPRPQPWQGCALPTELFPHFLRILCIKKSVSSRHFSKCECKGNAFFRTGKLFLSFFSKKVPFYRKQAVLWDLIHTIQIIFIAKTAQNLHPSIFVKNTYSRMRNAIKGIRLNGGIMDHILKNHLVANLKLFGKTP